MSAGSPSSWSSRCAATSRSELLEGRIGRVGRRRRRRGGGRIEPALDAGSFGRRRCRRAPGGSRRGRRRGRAAPAASSRSRSSRSMRSRRPARSPRVGSPVRQPRSISRRSASAEVAIGHDVVRERVQDLVGVEVGDRLAPVPARIPRGPSDGAGRDRRRSASVRRPSRAGAPPASPGPVDPGSTRSSGRAVIGGRRSRRGRDPC